MNLIFFHWSEALIDVFKPQRQKRPVFYWFSDRFHHLYDKNESIDYFYLFTKNPKKEGIELRSRETPSNFDTLYSSYLEYRDCLLDYPNKYSEPPILLSFTPMKADLTAKPIGPNMTYEIIRCENESSIGKQFSLLDESGNKIPFDQINVLKEALPKLIKSVPVQKIPIDVEYTYEGWNDMKGYDENSTWL